MPNYSQITQKTIKIIISILDVNSITKSFYESSFRLLKSLAINGMLSLERFFNMGFINNLQKYLINDVCFQYISIILEKICESSYYIYYLYTNEELIKKLIEKFYENTNHELSLNLLSVMTSLTSENESVSKQLYSSQFMLLIKIYIRNYEQRIKIFSINLMMNVLVYSGVNYENESLVKWSISILLNLTKELKDDFKLKTRTVNVLSMIVKKYSSLQCIIYNFEGIEILLKELRDTFTESKIKEMEDHAKSIKQDKSKRIPEEDTRMTSETYGLDELGEYRRSLIDALASASCLYEDSRKKIIESKEMTIFYSLLEDTQVKYILCTSNLMLSLSRAHHSVKKIINDYDIINTLFRLSYHTNVDIQIASTSSLCNFFLDSSSNTNELLDCVTKLLKIMNCTKQPKNRQNAIFAIKNILYHLAHFPDKNYKETKKGIIKKLSYEYLLNLLDDEDVIIQEQSLIIFRVLLHKGAEDVEEVLKGCKNKLVKKIEEKILSQHSDVVLQALYVILNICNGNEKHKAIILEKCFLDKISNVLCESSSQHILASVLIVNSLLKPLDFDKNYPILAEYEIFQKLEKIVNDDECDKETKSTANSIISRLKNLK